ncbi:MAG: tetratricopeptide repeat protein, partial [Woeseiaceae bacterium]
MTTEDLASVQEKIVEKRFDEALDDLARLREAEPDNPDALYMSAVCHRYKGDHETALAFLERLKQDNPEHGRAHQEEGHNYRDLG